MNLNQLKMHNLAPRGIRATCVPTSLCFVTGVSYQDIEYLLVREQPKTYRPEIAGNKGVNTQMLLGNQRVMFGHRFTAVSGSGSLLSFIGKYSVGTYLVCVPRHMLVVQNGQMFDLANTQYSSTITNVWKVEKIS
jgi:hypothetical protein